MANIKVSYSPSKGLVQEEVKSGEETFEIGPKMSLSSGGSNCTACLHKAVTDCDKPEVLREMKLKDGSACWLEVKVAWKNKTTKTSGFLYCMAYAQCEDGQASVGATKCIADDTPGMEDVSIEAVDGSRKVQILVMAPPGCEDDIEWNGKVESQDF